MQSEKADDAAKETEKLLEVARKRFEIAQESEREVRQLALEDLEFGTGEQWDPADKAMRQLQKRPCLTINRLPQFIRQIVNDQRQNRPAIKVSPVDDHADIETAKIFQGIIRHIEQASDAEVAYDTAFAAAVRSSFGYFRIRTDYCDPLSFDQEIKIEPIKNQFSVYLDPSARLPDGSDAQWGFICDELTKEEFDSQFPGKEATSLDWTQVSKSEQSWIAEGKIRIAEYFFKDFQEVTLLKLSDGQTIVKEDLEVAMVQSESLNEETGEITIVETPQVQLPLDENMIPLEVLGERKSKVPVVRHMKINGHEILEETQWPGKWIPIIPVLGEEIDVNGKRILESVIRHAKDSQRMLNYMKSAEAEVIALSPKAPYLIAEGQLEGYEKFWKTANTQVHPYLPYKLVALGGTMAPPPQRNAFEAPIQATTMASQAAGEDLKSTTGVLDAALGGRSNEQSGIAIQRRANQSQTSNFHFVDNLSRSIRHCGRQLVDLIPKVYDTERTQRILGEDGSEEVVVINGIFKKENGEQVRYDLGAGKYDVSVSTGPSYATKRQEAAAAMLELSKSIPQLGQSAPDLLMKSLDVPDAEALSERLKKTLPPGLADDPKKQPIPPQAQAQLQQMNQMIEQLTGQLNEAQEAIRTKKYEIDSKERIEAMKLETQAAIKLAELESGEARVLLEQQRRELDARSKAASFNQAQDVSEVAEPFAQEVEPDVQPATGGPSPGQFVE